MNARDHSLPELALVTGAASGIGLAVATLLARRGTRVALCDRDAARLEAACAAIEGQGGATARGYVLDVQVRDQVAETVSAVERDLGPIDALASVAGVLHMGAAVEQPNAGAALSEQDWHACWAVNAGGLFHLAQAVVPRMIARGRGALVTVASNAGRTPRVSMAAYAASKAAAVMYTKCLGLEVARYGIRCNVVSPGSTDTPMQQAFWSDSAAGEAQVIAGDLSHYRLGIPLGRIATPDEVAESVVYLLSERARHITLQELCVDGGATP